MYLLAHQKCFFKIVISPLYTIPYMSNHLRGKLSWFLQIFANCECFTIEIFLEYWHRPLTTQRMVPRCFINNEQSAEMLRGTWPTKLTLFKQLLHINLLDFLLPSHKPAVLQLPGIQHT